MLDIEIDGKSLKAPEGVTIIEAADAAGIYIPRFCYHCKLSIAANCRMCLVEVDKSRKPLPACATPITEGMKVYTRSVMARDAQRAVMEFLLINHPLDCPICDQGGECELQDISMECGRSDSEYTEPKRAVVSQNLGPLIETAMTRCIHCTRCVRFGEEIAGLREMGMTFRGEHSEIGTYLQVFLKSELSGNIIDLCPVGALINKPARYMGRAWEYREHTTIAPHDAVGSHLYVHTRAMGSAAMRRVMRVVPGECDAINETWISDRDRYSVHGLYHESRVYQPRMKINNAWVDVEWQYALEAVAARMGAIALQHGADQLAALSASTSTVEEFFLLQKMMRTLGSPHIDYRQREHDFSDQESMPLFPGLNMTLQSVEQLEVIVLIGCNVRLEQPLLAHRVNKAVNEGATVITINSEDYVFAFPVAHQYRVAPHNLLATVNALPAILATEKHKRIALFLGEQVLHHSDAGALRTASERVAACTGAIVGYLTLGPNAAGAWLAGAVPHRGPSGTPITRVGHNAKALLTTDPVRGYFLFNTEPELDSAYGQAAIDALQTADCVVCFTPFISATMEQYADFILPIAPFTETAGTFVNMEGEWQAFEAVGPPHQSARPGWKVLRVLAQFMGLSGFDYVSPAAISDEIKAITKDRCVTVLPRSGVSNSAHVHPERVQQPLSRLAPCLMYRVDALVRRSDPLQAMISSEDIAVGLSPSTAAAYGFADGEIITVIQNNMRVERILFINPRLADDTVLLSSGLVDTLILGDIQAPIQLERRAN